MEQSEKLQKILSRAGLGSRRVMEQVLREGRISVNGKVATLGDRATSSDVIRVDGRIIKIKAPSDRICRVFVYHKPEGEVCTEHDPEGRPSVFDRLPRIPGARLVGVGRLDLNTTGLLLFTTDGELANRLMHPGREIEREYSVRIFGELTEDMISLMLAGVEIEGVTYRFDSVRFTGGEGMNRWYSMVLHEGRNREIRRTLEHFDLQISRLIRVRFGSLTLDRDLPRGGWRELTLDEVNRLRELADLPRITKAADSGDDRDDREDFLRRRHRMNEIRRAVRRHGERRRKGEDGFSPFRGPVRPRLGGKRPGSGIGEGAGEQEKPWSRSPAGTPEGAPGDAAAGSGDQGSPWKKPAATWKARDGQGDRGGRFHGGGDRGSHADRGPRDGDERPFRGGKGGSMAARAATAGLSVAARMVTAGLSVAVRAVKVALSMAVRTATAGLSMVGRLVKADRSVAVRAVTAALSVAARAVTAALSVAARAALPVIGAGRAAAASMALPVVLRVAAAAGDAEDPEIRGAADFLSAPVADPGAGSRMPA